MAESKMIVAGYISLDITPAFPVSYKGRTLEDVVKPGKLRKVGAAAICPGGCVSNTGLALHVLGADVSLVAKVGDDSFGRLLQDSYRRLGAQADFIISPSVDTSYTIVIAVPGNDRCFLVDTGANDAFLVSDLNFGKISKADYFHFGYPPLMRSMYAEGGGQLAEMLRRVKEMGLVTSLDTALPDPHSDAGNVDWVCFFGKVLPYVDFFVPSIEELGYMIDRERFVTWQKRAEETGKDICMSLSLEEDVKPVAKKALSLGCKSVLLKCGAAGLYFVSSTEERMAGIGDALTAHRQELGEEAAAFTGRGWGGKDFFQDSYKPDRILSGTGAGDTAIAGFLYGLSHGMDAETCLQIAAGCGSMCITQYDTTSGLLPVPELRERILAGWETLHFIRE